MLTTQGSERWRELLGVSGKPTRWGYVAAFFVAYVLSVLSSMLVYMVFLLPADMVQIITPRELLRVNLTDASIYAPLTALCIVAGFRFLRLWTAVAVVPLLYAVVAIGADALRQGISPEGQPLAALLAYSVWRRYLFVGFLLLGVTLALRWLKSPWVALALGAWLGSLPPVLLTRLGAWLVLPANSQLSSLRTFAFDFRAEAFSSLISLFSNALWAGLLWAGLEIASAKKGTVSKRFYIASTAGPMQVIATGGLVIPFLRLSPDAVLLAIGVLAPFIIYSAVVMLVWLYKMWSGIQDGKARTTPGQAVGFLFIPLFNFYWVFQAFWGFAKDYNRYAQRHALPGPKLAAGVFLAFNILSFAGIIPYANYFLLEANSILAAVMIAKGCDAVNEIPAQAALPLAA